MSETIDADALARAIVSRLPRVPLDKTLWDNKQCAEFLHQSPRTFERTKNSVGFPEPVYTPTECRWAADVIDWARDRCTRERLR